MSDRTREEDKIACAMSFAATNHVGCKSSEKPSMLVSVEVAENTGGLSNCDSAAVDVDVSITSRELLFVAVMLFLSLVR